MSSHFVLFITILFTKYSVSLWNFLMIFWFSTGMSSVIVKTRGCGMVVFQITVKKKLFIAAAHATVTEKRAMKKEEGCILQCGILIN